MPNARARRILAYRTPAAGGDDSAISNPMAAIAGDGLRRSQIVGNPYLLPRDTLRATVSRLWSAGHYYNVRAATCDGFWVYLFADTVDSIVRGVIYGDNGSSTIGDDGTVTTGRSGARLGFGTTEVTIPANPSDTVGAWYFIPVTLFTIPDTTIVWPTLWTNASGGGGVYYASIANTSHWMVNTTSGQAPYSAVNPPPADFTALGQVVTAGREVTIFLSVTTILSTAPTISATPNSVRGVALSWSTPSPASHVRITRQAGGSEEILGVFPVAVTSWTDSDLTVGTSYTYRAYALRDNGASTAGSAVALISAPTRRAFVTASPTSVASSVYVPTPGHNFIKFDNTGTIPVNVTDYFDVMGRTDVAVHYWNVLETAANVYDFSSLKTWILANSSSGTPKRRVQFRIRCAAPNGSTATNFVPAYIPQTTSGSPAVTNPTWNGTVASGPAAGETVAIRMGKLIQAMGAYLTTENLWERISSIDVGMLHDFGEFSSTAVTPISSANAIVYFGYATAAITQVPLLLSMPSRDRDQAIYTALEAGTNVGLRADSHSGSNLATLVFISRRLFERSDRTRVFMYDNPRPSAVEWFSAGGISDPASLQRGLLDIAAPNPALVGDSGVGIGGVVNTNFQNYGSYSTAGKTAVENQVLTAGPRFSVARARYPQSISSGVAFSLSHWWVNAGVVAPFETWTPQFQLRLSGALVGSGQNSTLDLKNIQPTNGSPYAWSDSITFSGVSAGTYDLCVHVPGGTSYRDNMRLAMVDEVAPQVYRLLPGGMVVI